jgi:hypothetical protein
MIGSEETALSATLAAAEDRGTLQLMFLYAALVGVVTATLDWSGAIRHLATYMVAPERLLAWLPLIAASSGTGVVFWGMIGLLGYREIIGEQNIVYKFSKLPVNPSGVSRMFVLSLLVMIYYFVKLCSF